MADSVDQMVKAMDILVRRSRDVNLTPGDLIDIHTELAGIRHVMGTYMVEAEHDHAKKKERYDTHCIKARLLMQASDPKLSTARANDMLENETSTEVMRLEVIEADMRYKHLKQRLMTSNDVLVSISIRLGIAKQEMINLRQETR